MTVAVTANYSAGRVSSIHVCNAATPNASWRDFRCGSWLCENSETRNRDRTNISSKPRVQCAKIVRAFSSDQSEKNILVAFQFFEFLHTQVNRECAGRPARSRGCKSLTMKV